MLCCQAVCLLEFSLSPCLFAGVAQNPTPWWQSCPPAMGLRAAVLPVQSNYFSLPSGHLLVLQTLSIRDPGSPAEHAEESWPPSSLEMETPSPQGTFCSQEQLGLGFSHVTRTEGTAREVPSLPRSQDLNMLSMGSGEKLPLPLLGSLDNPRASTICCLMGAGQREWPAGAAVPKRLPPRPTYSRHVGAALKTVPPSRGANGKGRHTGVPTVPRCSLLLPCHQTSTSSPSQTLQKPVIQRCVGFLLLV